MLKVESDRMKTNQCFFFPYLEFQKIAVATAIGFAIMGFIGFFVRLIHIPINNIIVWVHVFRLFLNQILLFKCTPFKWSSNHRSHSKLSYLQTCKNTENFFGAFNKNYILFSLQRFMIAKENSERKFIIEHLPSTFGYYFIYFVVKHWYILADTVNNCLYCKIM